MCTPIAPTNELEKTSAPCLDLYLSLDGLCVLPGAVTLFSGAAALLAWSSMTASWPFGRDGRNRDERN
jgi:hypothetical protein